MRAHLSIILVILLLSNCSPVGRFGAGVDITFEVLQEPLENIIGDATDIIGLVLNIQRKEWKLAMVTLLDIVPSLSDWMDSFITFFHYLNKWIQMAKVYGFKNIIDKYSIFKTIENINRFPMQPDKWGGIVNKLSPIKL